MRHPLKFLFTASAVGSLALGCAPEEVEQPGESEDLGEARSELSQVLAFESEPNGAAATATPLSNDTVAGGYVFLSGDSDFFSFQGTAGSRVYAATATAFSPSSTDSLLDLIGPDGTTIIESDNDNGSLAALSSSLAGVALTQTGTHYLRVTQFGNSSTIRPYHLHLKTQSGSPVPEVEPNDMTPQALPPSGWVSGVISATTDVDVYSLALNAGDTVFASLDLDPERDGTEFNGQLAMGPFGGTFLQINDAGTTGPDSEALFVTVKDPGTYGIAVSVPTGATIGNYHLSVSVHPAQGPTGCSTFTSSAITAIPAGPGITTATINIPNNLRIGDVDVQLNINHANPPDLDITLTSPQGTVAGLFNDIGANTFPNLNFVLDDEAAFPAGSFTLLDGLVIQPENAFRLDYFDGQSAQGTWTLTIYDDLASNAGSLNGWAITICEPPPLPACGNGATAVTAFSTDFEANAAGFTTSGTAINWAYGTPAHAPSFTNCASGTSCFKTNLTGNYSASSNQDLVSPPINLTNVVGPIHLSWAMKYSVENAAFDPFWVEVREVGGANPKRVWQWTGPTMASQTFGNPSVTPATVAEWGLYNADISAFAGKSVEVVFHLQTDTSIQYPGFAIDDVKVSACPGSVCGNGTVEPSEACDDGNTTSGDGCDANCTVTACGNGIVTAGEACDDGNTTNGDGCDANCTVTACGNGIVTAGEMCDDGNTTSGDGCDANCTPTGCGNGVVTAGEACDDGNGVLGDGCDDGAMGNCTVTACGNGVQTAGEACDDGNAVSGDGCDANCTPTGCGNGIVTLGEMCDDGNGVLGDGCDDGAMGNCTMSACGNGVLAGGEGCDDGNLTDDDGCDSNCTTTGCGNGVVTLGEDCDDGNATSGDGCDNNCTATGCGNGVQTDGEACDDGNLDEGDGCDTNCTASACGNGIQAGDEACDDGNATEGDGCDSNCTETSCGNGIQSDGEACDDGNATDGDGCDTNCTATACGNGIQTAGEECDDGNKDSGDGCSETCTSEGQGGAGGSGAAGGAGGGTAGSGGTGGAGAEGGAGGAGGAGGGDVEAGGGCGCRVAGDSSSSTSWAPALALFGLSLLRLRRRRARG